MAAMGEGERAEVLEHFRPALVAYCNESIARAEKAELALADAGLERHGLRIKLEGAQKERDAEANQAHEARLDLARALKSNTAYSVAADEAIRDRDAALGERNRAQAERDEARKERDRSNHLRAGMFPDTRRELGALGCEDVADAARRVVSERNRAQEERDELRVKNDGLRGCLAERKTICEDAIKRAVAAETAAAQREPREYPLAEGSHFEGPCLVTAGKARVGIRPYPEDGQPALSMELLDGSGYWLYLADVLALAHRRGLL
jgi:hypothetical protein